MLRNRYPNSPYAKQAENRIRIAEDVLAASEMNVGRYYLKQNNHVGAINRFKVVVTEYQTTAHVEEALYRLSKPTWRSASFRRRKPPPPCSATTSRIPTGTPKATAC